MTETHKPQSLEPQDKVLQEALDLLAIKRKPTRHALDLIATYLQENAKLDPGFDEMPILMELIQHYSSYVNYPALLSVAQRLGQFAEAEAMSAIWAARACFFLKQKEQGLDYLASIRSNVGQMNDDNLHAYLETLIKYRSLKDAKKVINEVYLSNVSKTWFHVIQARIYLDSRSFDSVLKILPEEFISKCNNNAFSTSMWSMRARALEKKQEYTEAFKCFSFMNRQALELYEAPAALTEGLRSVPLESLPLQPHSDTDPYRPDFMIGFPRSGTTLFESILDTQSEIFTVSEVEGLDAARARMWALGKKYPADLSSLTATDIEEMRRVYYERNAPYIPDGTNFRVLIDKLPLNTLHVPLIRTLFPESRLIFSLRHPVDVCLSCYKQSYLPNSAMANFNSLENCFLTYRDVMQLFDTYLERLDLEVHYVRYEELVRNLEGECTSAFRFLGIEADDRYKEFHSINADKLIATPSDSQVIQPLYKDSCNLWKNYADQLKPYVPIVQPYIEKFGYAE